MIAALVSLLGLFIFGALRRRDDERNAPDQWIGAGAGLPLALRRIDARRSAKRKRWGVVTREDELMERSDKRQ